MCKVPEQDFPIKHPIRNPPEFTGHVKCNNCGMDRNMFARTRYEFKTARGEFHTCSIACVAILSMKLKEMPENVKVAEYLHPERMIDAERAIYVIGSRARGTMTRVSKIAFSDMSEAGILAERFGGRISGYDEAFKEAARDLQLHVKFK